MTFQITAKGLRTFHAVATVGWIVLIVPTIVWWRESITWVVFMSIYAIIVSHFEAWQTARLERNQEKKEEKDGKSAP